MESRSRQQHLGRIERIWYTKGLVAGRGMSKSKLCESLVAVLFPMEVTGRE